MPPIRMSPTSPHFGGQPHLYGGMIEPTAIVEDALRDRATWPFWNVADGQADYLITGDKDLLALEDGILL